jgi:hypothetical protein
MHTYCLRMHFYFKHRMPVDFLLKTYTRVTNFQLCNETGLTNLYRKKTV